MQDEKLTVRAVVGDEARGQPEVGVDLIVWGGPAGISTDPLK